MIDLSPLKPSLKGKPAAVMGLGASGMAVFAACRAAGIDTLLWDDAAERRAAAQLAGGRVEEPSAAGCALLCLAPGISPAHPLPAAMKAAGTEVTGDIELFHRALPRARCIGITGTNGKSTTTALCGHILRESGVECAVGGNIGAAALALPQLGAEGIYVLELSSYQLDLCATFAPGIAVLTNLAPDHLDRHGGMEGYVAAKEKIFRGPGTAVIGAQDLWSRALLCRVRAAGERRVAEGVSVTAEGILREDGADVADLKDCPALKGVHNWQNAAAAYAACRAAGAEPARIAAALKSFPGLAHRQFPVARIGAVTYVNDSKATNDQAAAVALAAWLRIYWIAGGKSKGAGYEDCARHLGNVRRAFLIGAAAEELAAFLSARGVAFTRCGTLSCAVDAAHHAAQDAGEEAAVLLSPACASFDQFRSFEHRGEVFESLVRGLAAPRQMKGAVP